MKSWQVIVSVLVLAAAGWAIVSFPPGQHAIRLEAIATPVPTPEPRPEREPVSLLFAGDIMLSRSVGDIMVARGDWTWPFGAVASITSGADIMFANLESVIASRGAQGGCGYCFRADPRAVQGLMHAGVDVVSLANNHAWDFGLPALEDSLAYLAANDISVAGAGRTLTEARAPVVLSVRGTRIAYLAYTDMLPAAAQATETQAGVNRYDPQRMAEDIARARAVSDVVIVSFHTGTEYEPVHNAGQERIYRSAVDAGADIVVGHHPHVVQDSERYRGGWIFYSLGNFVFDQGWSAETMRGALLSVTIDAGSVSDAVLIPVDISAQYRVSVGR